MVKGSYGNLFVWVDFFVRKKRIKGCICILVVVFLRGWLFFDPLTFFFWAGYKKQHAPLLIHMFCNLEGVCDNTAVNMSGFYCPRPQKCYKSTGLRMRKGNQIGNLKWPKK